MIQCFTGPFRTASFPWHHRQGIDPDIWKKQQGLRTFLLWEHLHPAPPCSSRPVNAKKFRFQPNQKQENIKGNTNHLMIDKQRQTIINVSDTDFNE